MNDINIESIKEALEANEKALATAERRLKGVPKESILYRKVRGKQRFYRYDRTENGRKELYLGGKNLKKITTLADKRYCEAFAKAVRSDIDALNHFTDAYQPEQKYLAYSDIPAEIRELVNPITRSPEERCRLWQQEPFQKLDIPIESDYVSKDGLRVRSRAEYMICDIIAQCGLTKHYEQRLRLNINGTMHDIYPDFTIMHPKTCELYYLEFFGMMDDPEYAKSAFEKIQMYQSAGLGARLIAIFDSKAVPFKSTTVEALLKAFFFT